MELKDFATINFEIKYSSSAFKHGMTEADKSLAEIIGVMVREKIAESIRN